MSPTDHQLSDRQYRRQFYQAVDQRQAVDDRQAHFYVPIYDRPEMRPHDVIAAVRDVIDFTADHESVQVLSGTRGAGKSSELLRLRDELLSTSHTVAFMDVRDYLNTELPLEGGAFLIALAAGFAEGFGGQSADGAASRAWASIANFFERLNVDVGLSAGPLALKATLADDDRMRTRIHEAIRSSRKAFREEFHAYFSTLASSVEGGGSPIFIVDSIDHYRGRRERFHEVRESVETVFNEMADDLAIPGVHMIYTVPTYVLPAVGVRQDLLNVKVAHPNGDPYEPGLAALGAVLHKRAPAGDVDRLFGSADERLLRASGGVVRHVLQLSGQLLLKTDRLPATEADIAWAEYVVRNNMVTTLSREQVEILRSVSRTQQLRPTHDEWPDVWYLQSISAVLTYPNGEQPWYGVHPLLRPLLDSGPDA